MNNKVKQTANVRQLSNGNFNVKVIDVFSDDETLNYHWVLQNITKETLQEIVSQAYKQGFVTNWISVKDELPPLDDKDLWNLEHGISKLVLTKSEHGFRFGRFYKESNKWHIEGVMSTNGVKVTDWQIIE